MNALNPWRVGIATAITAAIISTICALAIYLFPQGTINFVNSWTHIDITTLMIDRPWTLKGLALGVFNAALTGFLTGALFAGCYNLIRTS